MQTQTTGTATMTETAAGEFLTSDHLSRYLAGLARLDAAVKASCPKCSGPLERIDERGMTMVECPACFFCEKVS